MKNDADSICQIHYHSYHALAYFDVGSLSQLQVCSSLEGKKGVLLKKEKKKKEGEGEAEKKKKIYDLFWLLVCREKPDRNRMFVPDISC